jgi:hypothetical protein
VRSEDAACGPRADLSRAGHGPRTSLGSLGQELRRVLRASGARVARGGGDLFFEAREDKEPPSCIMASSFRVLMRIGVGYAKGSDHLTAGLLDPERTSRLILVLK